tara:strand:- start:263 stop:496 length:234 start_codon:yes stop_codon:yes gene_type:complete
MEKIKRYTVVIDTYIYAENDYMARKIAHKVKDECPGYETKVIEIVESKFASLNTRKLEDISKPQDKHKWTEEDELPF